MNEIERDLVERFKSDKRAIFPEHAMGRKKCVEVGSGNVVYLPLLNVDNWFGKILFSKLQINFEVNESHWRDFKKEVVWILQAFPL